MLDQGGALRPAQTDVSCVTSPGCQATIPTALAEPPHGVGLPGPALISSQSRACGSRCPGELGTGQVCATPGGHWKPELRKPARASRRGVCSCWALKGGTKVGDGLSSRRPEPVLETPVDLVLSIAPGTEWPPLMGVCSSEAGQPARLPNKDPEGARYLDQ